MNPLAILAFILGIQTISGEPQPKPDVRGQEQAIRDASSKENPVPHGHKKLGGGGGSDMN